MFSISGPGWRISELEAVLFDKDGTLVDLHFYWGEIIRRRANAVIAHHKLEAAVFPRLCAAMGLSVDQQRLLPEGPVGLVSREEVIQALHGALKDLGVATSPEIMAELFVRVHQDFQPDVERFVQLIPGAAAFVAALRKAGAKLAVVTSDTAANTRQTLRRFRLGECFDSIVGHETTPEPKISGVPARHALEELGGSGEKTVCIGDGPMDFLMAEKSGCRAAIGVATGQIPGAELARYTKYVTPSLADLTVERLS